MNRHEFFIRKTLDLAEKGRYNVSPNPMVGAVLVKGKKVISSAYHKRVGGLHAEAMAIKKAGKRARGADLYVNLEPCVHKGRTPACVDAIVQSGIKRVFCAMKDPNPLNNGLGVKKLRKKNISVKVGIFEKEALALNHVFVKYITKNMPFVILKMAESLDGKIATKTGDSKWITSDMSRRYVHRLRSEVDAILIGVNTIEKDNPLLTSRGQKNPIKVILDPDFKVQLRSRIFTKKSPALSIVVIGKNKLSRKDVLEKIKGFSRKGILVISCIRKKGLFDLSTLLKELADLEISRLLIEGGGKTAAGFLEQGLVDRVMFFISPLIIGGKDAVTSVEGSGIDRIKQALRLKNIGIKQIGQDILINGDLIN